MIEPQSMQLGASAWVWNETFVPPRLRVIGAVEPPPFPFVDFPLAACPFPSEPFVAMTASGSLAGADATAGSAATAVALGASVSGAFCGSAFGSETAGAGSAREEFAEPWFPLLNANEVGASPSSETRSWSPRLTLSSGDRKR